MGVQAQCSQGPEPRVSCLHPIPDLPRSSSGTIHHPEALSFSVLISSLLLNSDSHTVYLSAFIPQAFMYYLSGLSLSILQGYCNLFLKLCQHFLADFCLDRLGRSESHVPPNCKEGWEL